MRKWSLFIAVGIDIYPEAFTAKPDLGPPVVPLGILSSVAIGIYTPSPFPHDIIEAPDISI